MGRLYGRPCVAAGCDKVEEDEGEGVAFNIKSLFRKTAADKDKSMDMWACCKDHKKEALSLLVKDMPLSKRIKLL